MSGKMVPITVYTNTIEAGMIKSRLESAGVATFLEGEESGNLFGITNVQGVRVLIHEDDIERAERILNQFDTEEADDYQEPRFQKRRKRHKSSEAIRAPGDSPLQAPTARTEPSPETVQVQKPEAEVEQEPQEESVPPEEAAEERPLQSLFWTPDDFARYALQGAVLGIFCFVGTLFSFYMLVRLASLHGDLSKRGRLMAWGAVTLDFLTILGLFLVWYVLQSEPRE